MNRSEAEDFIYSIIEKERPRILVVSRTVFFALLPGESPGDVIGFDGIEVRFDKSFDTYRYHCDP